MKNLYVVFYGFYQKYFKQQSYTRKIILIIVIFIAFCPLFYKIESNITLTNIQIQKMILIKNLEKISTIGNILYVYPEEKQDEMGWALIRRMFIPVRLHFRVMLKTKNNDFLEINNVTLKSIYNADDSLIKFTEDSPDERHYPIKPPGDFRLGRIYQADKAPQDYYSLYMLWYSDHKTYIQAIKYRADLEVLFGKKINGIEDFLNYYKEWFDLYARAGVYPYTVDRDFIWSKGDNFSNVQSNIIRYDSLARTIKIVKRDNASSELKYALDDLSRQPKDTEIEKKVNFIFKYFAYLNLYPFMKILYSYFTYTLPVFPPVIPVIIFFLPDIASIKHTWRIRILPFLAGIAPSLVLMLIQGLILALTSYSSFRINSFLTGAVFPVSLWTILVSSIVALCLVSLTHFMLPRLAESKRNKYFLIASYIYCVIMVFGSFFISLKTFGL